MSARMAAIKAISSVDRGETAQAALGKAGDNLDPVDRSLCSDLVYGTLRTRLRVEYLLGQVLARPSQLPPYALIALQTAAYSLLFQEKIPAYATVNETVNLIKKRFGQRLANVANGSLRGLLRLGNMPLQKKFYGEKANEAESRYYSIPPQLAELWRNAYGSETATKLMERSLRRPPACLRVNLRAKAGAAVAAALKQEFEPIGPYGFVCPPGKLPSAILGRELSSWQQEGVLSFQGAGSQAALCELGLYKDWQGVPVWDACSGMGGKSTALLEAGLEVTLASDPSAGRLRLLPLECARLSLPVPIIAQADAIIPPLNFWSGNILVDAPCSGLGVLARRPDLKGRWSLAKIDELVHLQTQILDSLVFLLAPGRELCYLTCTLNPQENEEQVNRLLQKNPDLELVCQWQTPHEHRWLEGMFGARFKRVAC